MTLYRDILKNAWNITWKNKFLWFFGFFAAFLGGTGGLEILTKNPSLSATDNILPGFSKAKVFFSIESLRNLGNLFKEDTVLVIVFILLALIIFFLFVFFAWLSIVSQAALVNDSEELYAKNRKIKKLGIQKGIIVGIKNFWPVLGINVLSKLVIGIAFMIIALPIGYMAYKANFLLLSFSFILLFVLLISVAVIFSFMMRYAICYIVIKKQSITDALKNSFRLFKDNWLVSVEMAFLLVFISFLLFLCFMVVISIASLPLFFLSVVFYKMLSYIGFWFMMTITLVLLIVLLVVGGAILTTFQISSWTLLFVELEKKRTVSKVLRIFYKS